MNTRDDLLCHAFRFMIQTTVEIVTASQKNLHLSNNNVSDVNVTGTINCKTDIEHFSTDKSLDRK